MLYINNDTNDVYINLITLDIYVPVLHKKLQRLIMTLPS